MVVDAPGAYAIFGIVRFAPLTDILCSVAKRLLLHFCFTFGLFKNEAPGGAR